MYCKLAWWRSQHGDKDNRSDLQELTTLSSRTLTEEWVQLVNPIQWKLGCEAKGDRGEKPCTSLWALKHVDSQAFDVFAQIQACHPKVVTNRALRIHVAVLKHALTYCHRADGITTLMAKACKILLFFFLRRARVLLGD